MYKVVVPGDFISTEANRAGEGTYVEDGNVYALKYGVLDDRSAIKVVALSGKYMPVNGDVVIGKIIEISFPYWIVDIASPYEARLRKSEFGRGEQIDFGNMCEYLDIDDLIVAKVINVDVMMRIDLALKNEFKMDGVGRLIEVSPAKVPRIIGRSGSMIKLLKEKSNCFIFVAKNGRIWIKGSSADMDIASQTVMKIANEAHTSGLTDRVAHFLDSFKNKKGEG